MKQICTTTRSNAVATSIHKKFTRQLLMASPLCWFLGGHDEHCNNQRIVLLKMITLFQLDPLPSASLRKLNHAFHLLYELTCGQQLEMIAGVEYNSAFFQVLTVPTRNCIYVVGPKKQSEYCSHMLQVYESVSALWYVSSVSYEHGWFWELSWCRNGVFLINRPGELCPLVSRTGILWCEH